ncbi:8840_t:CDS:2, partial [Funneliformis mosseae]
CWKYETDERPNMQKVVSTLKIIISLENSEMIDADFNEEIELPIKGISSLKSSIEIDEELEGLELSEGINNFTEIKSSQSNNNSSFKLCKKRDEVLEDLEIPEVSKKDDKSILSFRIQFFKLIINQKTQ